MKITVKSSDMRKFTNAIKGEVIRREANAIPDIKRILMRTSIELASKIESSADWQSLKSSKLIAEFGFAPWEVDELNEILRYLVPAGNNDDITTIDSNASIVGSPRAILHWVDFPKLLWNPFGMHELSRRGSRQQRKSGGTVGGFNKGDVVSWLEWFEYGVTIPGYDVEYPIGPKAKFFSRSGLGLMKPEEGGMWAFHGTSLFENTASSFTSDTIKLTKEIYRVTKRNMKRKN